MRKRIYLFLLLSLGLTAAGTAQTREAYPSVALRLREAPSTEGKHILTIPAGRKLEVHDCARNWCSVTFSGVSGYVAERYLSDTPPPKIVQQGKGYVNSRGEWVPSPARTIDNRPPAGASARCRDGTYSFSRSRRGTCSHHGGVAQWL